MNAEQLLQHFERISEAPDAIKRLRRFILDLAVRGKLVEQDPSDEPAAELLKRIAAENLEVEDLPQGWRKAKIGSVLNFQYGKGLKASERLDKGPVPVFGSNGIVGYTDDPLTVCPSIIIGRKGSAGALNICDGPSWTTDVAYFVEAPSFLTLRFLLNVLASIDLDKLGKGVKPGLSRSEAYEQIIPLPPLAEQQRIVAKVDELMNLCDQLDAAKAEREKCRDSLVAASLQGLNQPAEEEETFREYARFTFNNLPQITTRAAHIKQLRQTILNLAVRGKLVEQDPSDEPATELLKRIMSETPQSKSIEVRNDPWPYILPECWTWTRFGRLIAKSDAGWSPKTENYPRSGENWGVLKVSAVSWDEFRPWENKQVLPETEPRAQAVVKLGDFLISRANTAELIGRAVIVNEEPVKLMMSDKIVRLYLSSKCNPRYLWMVNNYSDSSRAHYVRGASGVSPSMKNISRDVILNLPLPLPPLAEQHRIVTKVDELMSLCDQLEAQITVTEQDSRRFLESVLADALAPGIECNHH